VNAVATVMLVATLLIFGIAALALGRSRRFSLRRRRGTAATPPAGA
jgi:hypothetical protein